MMDTEIGPILESIGLSRTQQSVYLTALQHPGETVQELSRRTAINRTQLYDVLQSLQTEGLISAVIQNSKQRFSATPPTALARMLEQRQRDLNALMPTLLAMQGTQSSLLKVEVFDGAAGVRTALREHLEEKSFLVLGAGDEFSEQTKFFYDQYHAERIRRKITQQVLFRASAIDRATRSADAPFSDARTLPTEYVGSVVSIIYGSNVALLSWNDQRIVIIRSLAVAETYRSQFSILWKASAPTTKKKKNAHHSYSLTTDS